MAKQNYGGVYANMDFHPYVYTEYPKHVSTGNGRYEVVNNEAEELKILDKLQIVNDAAPAEAIRHVADPEKDILIARAYELGVAINRKWSKQKLEQVVKTAEDDVDSLPADETTIKPVSQVVVSQFEIPEETPPVDEKAELLAEAKALGITPQGVHLWGIPRLKAAIAEVKARKGA